jgi:hypothetical protein
MLTDKDKGMFRPQRHNTPLATLLGLLVLLSEIENITKMLASAYNYTPFHDQNLENLIHRHHNLRGGNPMQPAPVCPLCEVAIAAADALNVVGALIVQCTRCLYRFHKLCIDMPANEARVGNWVCLCCKRSSSTTTRTAWTWDLEIEKRIPLTPESCQYRRIQDSYVIDGVVRVWKDDACIFFIAGKPLLRARHCRGLAANIPRAPGANAFCIRHAHARQPKHTARPRAAAKGVARPTAPDPW